MPSLHLDARRSAPPAGCTATRRDDRLRSAHRHRGAVAAGLVEAHDQVAATVVGALHAADLHATVVDATPAGAAAPSSPAGHDPQRQVQRLGLVQHVVQARAVRQHADRHPCRPWSASGSGYFAARSSDTRTPPSCTPWP